MCLDQMIRIIKKNICFVLALLLFLYVIVCDFLMTFSFSMNLVFGIAIVLLLMLQYMIFFPVDKEFRGPSFIRVFAKVVSTFFFLGITLLIVFNVFYTKNYISDHNHKFDYIIVFGAGISNNKNVIMNGRIEKAIEYSKKYENCRFVLTGAKGDNEPIEEAIYMKNYMTERGVDGKRVLVDTLSYNTYENINNSLNLIKKDILNRNKKENILKRPFKNTESNFDLDFLNIGFMSSEFHLSRINMMARKLGINRPYDIACDTKNFYKLYMYVREDLSLFKAFVLNQLKF